MKLHLKDCLIDLENRTLWRNDERKRLSQKECGLLKYLAARPNEVVEREELYREVYRYRKGIQTRTLDVTIIRLRKKIEQDPHNPDHILSVYGSGYMFAPKLDGLGPVLEPKSVKVGRSNIEFERSPFFGRTDELNQLDDLMTASRACVTVLGPPGTGKTRFIKQWSKRQLETTNGSTLWFFDLSEAREQMDVLKTVARCLEVPLSETEVQPDELGQRLGFAIKERKHTVLLLDNAETVVQWVRKWVQKWGTVAQDARFLVTSQVPLGLGMEQRMILAPLVIEHLQNVSNLSQLMDSPVMALFVDRARAVKPDFAVTAENQDDVVAILRGLDGLPLAIELAAAHIHLMTPVEILKRLNRRFQFLRQPGRSGTSRNRTLVAALDSSWELLKPWEQSALAQCSVFCGGFDWDSVEYVVDVSTWPESPWVLDVVSTLIERCLIQVMEVPGKSVRLSMLVSVADYAAKRLASGEFENRQAAHRRHAKYFSLWGYQDTLDSLRGFGGIEKRNRLIRNIENLAVAFERSVDASWSQESAHVLAASVAVWRYTGPLEVVVRRGPSLVELELTQPVEALVLRCMSKVYGYLGRIDEGCRCLERALHLYQRLADQRREADVYLQLSKISTLGNRYMKDWENHSRIAGKIYDEIGFELGVGSVNADLAWVLMCKGQYAEARGYLEKSRFIAEKYGDFELKGLIFQALGDVALDELRYDVARHHYLEAYELARRMNSQWSEGDLLGNLGVLCSRLGQLRKSLPYYQRALDVHRRAGNRNGEALWLDNIGLTHLNLEEFDLAEEALNKANTIFKENRDNRRHARSLVHIAELYSCKRDFESALHCAKEAQSAVKNSDDMRLLAYATAVVGQVLVADKRLEEGAEYYEKALLLFKNEDASMAASYRASLAVLRARMGRYDDADALFELATPHLCKASSPSHVIILCQQAEVECLRGQKGLAETHLEKAQEIVQELEACSDGNLIREIQRVRQVLSQKMRSHSPRTDTHSP